MTVSVGCDWISSQICVSHRKRWIILTSSLIFRCHYMVICSASSQPDETECEQFVFERFQS